MAEYEGHTIRGKLIETSTGLPVFSYSVVPLIAFPGNDIQLFSGHIDSTGTVSFHTQRADGFSDMVTTLAGNSSEQFRVNIESPYLTDYPAAPLSVLDMSAIEKEWLLQRSVGLQVQYAYSADSLLRFDYPKPHFFYPPDHRYILDEYRKFGTMEEVIIEFVTFARFYNVNRKRYLGILREEYGYGNPNTLVLIDGIPIFDHRIVSVYNPLLLQRIDTYYEPFVIGGLRYDGIIALYTDQNLAPELNPDPYTQIIAYEGPQAAREFYGPDYSVDLDQKRHLPDFRHTLYWNPEVSASGQTSLTLPFYTSDLPETYRITVEGITREGRVVYAASDFRVQ
ncbi:MAG: hypothetical protein LUD68_03060 [Rikenellaceae bacterium]|nr:hypothetical protein [Rikenellaceae bacterium]